MVRDKKLTMVNYSHSLTTLILPLQCYVGVTVYAYFEDAQNGDFSKTERGTHVRKPEPNLMQSLGKDFMNL
jgi:hypothetical protein